MANPGGNYPGRQIFAGRLNAGEEAFAYYVSGRSPASQRQYATDLEEREGSHSVRIRPIDPGKPDRLRHYEAVRIDPETGLVVVSNSQAPVDAASEAYNSIPVGGRRSGDFLRDLLWAIGPEYDNPVLSKRTPRIMGIVYPSEREEFELSLAIVAPNDVRVVPVPLIFSNTGIFSWVSTYNGDVDYEPFDPEKLVQGSTVWNSVAINPQQLAEDLYTTSHHVDLDYGSLRVAVVAGVRNGRGPGGWEVATKNRWSKKSHEQGMQSHECLPPEGVWIDTDAEAMQGS